jgi:hypothetical protein
MINPLLHRCCAGSEAPQLELINQLMQPQRVDARHQAKGLRFHHKSLAAIAQGLIATGEAATDGLIHHRLEAPAGEAGVAVERFGGVVVEGQGGPHRRALHQGNQPEAS